MATYETTFERASAMPAPTWHFLDMNDTRIAIPEGLVFDPKVNVEIHVYDRACGQQSSENGRDDDGAFERALAKAQADWEKHHPAPTAEERAEFEQFRAAEADATYGGTARSGYQADADALEESRSLAAAFKAGVGDEAAAFLRSAAKERIVLTALPGQTLEAAVSVGACDGALSAAAIDVVAGVRSNVTLLVNVDGEREGAASARSVCATTLRVFADVGSKVEVSRTQTLDEQCVDIDDTGLFLGEGARVEVSQTVLGAGQSYTGLAADLRGEEADLSIDTNYLGRGEQVRDFNYVVRHHGPKTTCDLSANGVLAGKSVKTLRGTIDLIRGAKGAQGTEKENVLLVDEGVRNKTVPVILCNEDDVAGNHGATIGHIRPEQLFYLASRGLSQQDAERMFVSAIVEQAVLDAPSDGTRANVIQFGERMAPGFAELFD